MQSEATTSSGKSTAGNETARAVLDLASPYTPGKAEKLLRSAANNLQRSLAKARSLQGVMAKSDLLKNTTTGDARQRQIEKIQRSTADEISRINDAGPENRDRLVLKNIIHPTLKRSCEANLGLGMTTQELKQALQVARFDPDFRDASEASKEHRERLEKPFLKMLSSGAAKSRQNDWTFRIGEEMEMAQKDGRYPFMVTLTYDRTMFPHKDENGDIIYESASDMWRQGREVQYFLDAVAREVCKEMGHPAFNRKDALHPRSYYLQKFAMQEHGHLGLNDHVHLVMWLREIPSSWKQCPNRFVVDPAMRKYRRCKPIESFWKWGFSQADYFRHINDIWSRKHNFATPIGLKMRPACEAGGYFIKYISKEDKQWPHRVRATRGLGMARIDAYIRRLRISEAQALTWRPQDYETFFEISKIHCVPMGLVKARAKQQVFYLQMMQGSIDPGIETTRRESVYLKMIAAVRDGDRPDRKSPKWRYNWISRFLRPPPEYCPERQRQAFERLAIYFPPKEKPISPPVSVPGMSI